MEHQRQTEGESGHRLMDEKQKQATQTLNFELIPETDSKNNLPANATEETLISPIEMIHHLLLDGKVQRASWNSSVKEHVVHLLEADFIHDGFFILGARPTTKGKNGEWGAGMSLLDSLSLPQHHRYCVSGDAGFCTWNLSHWIHHHNHFYFWKLKQNAGDIYFNVYEWGQTLIKSNPDGDLYDLRQTGSSLDQRRIWRIPQIKHSLYPGIQEAFMIQKQDLNQSEEPSLQFVITNVPPKWWTLQMVLHRILGHWKIEKGCFGRKDHSFGEDANRYANLQGALAHMQSLNFVMNFLNAPQFIQFWKHSPSLDERMQIIRDNPKIIPLS